MKTIDDVLQWARQNWGPNQIDVHEVVAYVGVKVGDLARVARGVKEGKPVDHQEVKKELGNLFLSSLRWAEELGYDPQECIALAKIAQEDYAANRR